MASSLWSCDEGRRPGGGLEINWRRAMALLASGQGGDVNEIRPWDGISGFAKYDRSRRAPFVAMLQRSLPVPGDAISVICEFWLRVGEYNQHTNLFLRFC